MRPMNFRFDIITLACQKLACEEMKGETGTSCQKIFAVTNIVCYLGGGGAIERKDESQASSNTENFS